MFKPIPTHPYHRKTDAELRYIVRDASDAARAMRGFCRASECKYLDQVNDAATVLSYRRRAPLAPVTLSEAWAPFANV